MPELPEVETIRRQLCDAGVEGRIIEKVSIGWPRTVDPLSPAAFRKQVVGRTIEKLSRHGKWLIFELEPINPPRPTATPPVEGNRKCAVAEIPSEGGVPERRGGYSPSFNLLVHLRMTGGFYLSQGFLRKGPYDRVVLQLSGGLNLHFRDPRKFGRMRLEPSPAGRALLYPESLCCHDQNSTGSRIQEACPTIKRLGPDVLAITKKQFFQSLEKKNRGLKALLLDQSFIAGIGNIYADEALFEARLHPERRSSSLSDDERVALFRAVKRVIKAGVRNGGTSLGDGQGNYTDLNGESGGHREKVKAYGRAGQSCVACGHPLQKTKLAQRTTVFCPHCQV